MFLGLLPLFLSPEFSCCISASPPPRPRLFDALQLSSSSWNVAPQPFHARMVGGHQRQHHTRSCDGRCCSCILLSRGFARASPHGENHLNSVKDEVWDIVLRLSSSLQVRCYSQTEVPSFSSNFDFLSMVLTTRQEFTM